MVVYMFVIYMCEYIHIYAIALCLLHDGKEARTHTYVCIRMHADIQDTFSPKKSNENKTINLTFYNAIRNAESIRIQPIKPILIKKKL